MQGLVLSLNHAAHLLMLQPPTSTALMCAAQRSAQRAPTLALVQRQSTPSLAQRATSRRKRLTRAHVRVCVCPLLPCLLACRRRPLMNALVPVLLFPPALRQVRATVAGLAAAITGA